MHLATVQVDVLEAQFSQLSEKIESTHDFESIKLAHEGFVTTLQSQLFFTMPAVSAALSEVRMLSLIPRHSSSLSDWV